MYHGLGGSLGCVRGVYGRRGYVHQAGSGEYIDVCSYQRINRYVVLDIIEVIVRELRTIGHDGVQSGGGAHELHDIIYSTNSLVITNGLVTRYIKKAARVDGRVCGSECHEWSYRPCSMCMVRTHSFMFAMSSRSYG